MGSLSVIDIAPFLVDPTSTDAITFVERLRETLHGPGFCYLVGHGVDPTAEAAVATVAREFFDRPEVDRLAIVNTNTPHFRGYTRLGMEHTNGVSDWRDQIDIGPEHVAVDVGPDDPAWLRVRGPNQWPPSVPAMEHTVMGWMAQMAQVGAAVLRAIAVGLGQPPDLFVPVCEPEPEVLVKIIRYPAQDVESDTGQGVGLHHDSGLLSFILQDDVGGLQVQLGDELVDATPMNGALILNIGEMLQIATDGYLRATKHRVISPPPGRDRLSVAYFYNPRMEATMQRIPLPAALAAEAPGGQNARPGDTIFSNYGDNWLKFRLRSHPDVAAVHHADLVGRFT
ncbi:MAG: 2-oxoglutarate and iron-dependent oxygenase domain-containing protein [Ilumatobacteraceae bacterium]